MKPSDITIIDDRMTVKLDIETVVTPQYVRAKAVVGGKEITVHAKSPSAAKAKIRKEAQDFVSAAGFDEPYVRFTPDGACWVLDGTVGNFCYRICRPGDRPGTHSSCLFDAESTDAAIAKMESHIEQYSEGLEILDNA
jgi:hypothetical protein